MRDYVQTDGISWFLVGDLGLRRFIAQEVDRLDDIISYEVTIDSLTKKEYQNLIEKRIEFYRSKPKAELPIDQEVFIYLYEITKGRLRYIFGLLRRLVNHLYVGDLTDRLTLDIARPMVVKLVRDRIARNNLQLGEEHILKVLVNIGETTVTSLANKAEKSVQYTSRMLSELSQRKLVTMVKYGKTRRYMPVLDASIAYGEY